MKLTSLISLPLLLATLSIPAARADDFGLEYQTSLTLAQSGGNFAPYYMASNRHGTLTQATDVQLRQAFWHPLDTARRWSYAFAVDALGGYSSAVDYQRFNATDGQFFANAQRPAGIWLQQLYAMVKYRGVFLSAGLKEHQSALLDNALTSGDLTEGSNGRPVPQVRVGFIDFQDIPFTRGWVQIQGEISYGKMTDNDWLRNHYNYYDGHINTGALYTYKRCYFRTKPSQPFSATIGMQVAGFFGGTTKYYTQGRLTRTQKLSTSFKQFFKMFIPADDGIDYHSGSTLGSWDLQLRYRLPSGLTLKAYVEKPWEDGSGIGLLNGWDGLWGCEIHLAHAGLISAAVLEYIDFTNQGGPTHWDPDDHPGTTVTYRAEGADNYYNNFQYNSFANYGMSLGTPFIPSPIYNTDGYLQFANNRVRGFHLGLRGACGRVDYRLLGGYRKGWGTPQLPLSQPTHTTSLMAEGTYSVPRWPGLQLQLQLALDHGSMFGNHFGACITASYRGLLKL